MAGGRHACCHTGGSHGGGGDVVAPFTRKRFLARRKREKASGQEFATRSIRTFAETSKQFISDVLNNTYVGESGELRGSRPEINLLALLAFGDREVEPIHLAAGTEEHQGTNKVPRASNKPNKQR
jgi:hypothetical protein